MTTPETESVSIDNPSTSAFHKMAAEMLPNLSVEEFADLLQYNNHLEEQANLPEAVGSCHTILIGPGGSEVMVTVRGVSIQSAWAQLEEFVRKQLARGYRPLIKHGTETPPAKSAQPTQAAPPVQGAPTQGAVPPTQSVPTQAAAPGYQTGGSFEAQTLLAQVSEGKTSWRVKGGRFSQYGLIIYPETLVAAGFDVDQLDPLQVYSLAGYTAEYVNKDDGKPKKVVKLSR